MRLESINRIKVGDVLAKNILTNNGQVLLRTGVKLNQLYIDKLKKLGVFYIYVYDDRLDDIIAEDSRLMSLKQSSIKSMNRIMKNIHDCNGRDLKKSLATVESLIDYILEDADVNSSLYDIQTYDNYTYVHSLDTCIMATFLGISCNYTGWDLKKLGIGAVLHDVGKTEVPINVLNKSDKLTDEEFNEIKKHPIYGVDILKKFISIPDSVIKVVGQHHERVDGKGYPYGLTDLQITNFAKIVCICDVYDAVSNDRCYRKKFSPNDAYELILAGSGVSFDDKIVQNFKNTFSVYPLGCCVRLSNGKEGYVVRQNKGFPDRPVVRVLYDAETMIPIPIYEIDLIENTNIVISEVVI
ncbi:HD-GYP domain-containing protein [Clostridium sp. JN-1]|uniref:HD-GYP domain-containing protein n=1 Tax=Clostridium sp. JN-1 TaxID=2483110 RepID=UPI000F0BC7CF|nr:HD-GYP domain-containing protein [Clostridium sp. JN-1]